MIARGGVRLYRRLADVDFRYHRRSAVDVEDTMRHDMLLAAIGGKRLTYLRLEKPVSPNLGRFAWCIRKHYPAVDCVKRRECAPRGVVAHAKSFFC